MAIMNIAFYLGQVYAYFCDFYPNFSKITQQMSLFLEDIVCKSALCMSHKVNLLVCKKEPEQKNYYGPETMYQILDRSLSQAYNGLIFPDAGLIEVSLSAEKILHNYYIK